MTLITVLQDLGKLNLLEVKQLQREELGYCVRTGIQLLQLILPIQSVQGQVNASLEGESGQA